MLVVRKAFRFLTEGPPSDDPFAGILPPPPPDVAARIAECQIALDRLRALNATGGGLLASQGIVI